MPPSCSITDCKRFSCALCHCCQQNLCLSHLKEHQQLLISRLEPLVDKINLLDDRVNGLDVENLISKAREKLESWRIDCYQKIDEYLENKYSQLMKYVNQKIDRQRHDIDRMRCQLTELVQNQEVTREDIDSLNSKINQIELSMLKVEQTSFVIHIKTGNVEENIIQIEELNNSQGFDLTALSQISKTITCPKDNWAPLATNDKHLLLYQKPNLCLVNQDFSIEQKTLWSFGEIWDMFWSLTLQQFIIINENNVFLIDENTMSIESIQMIAKQNWCCGTCSEKSLYLATYRRGASIMEFNLLPSIEFVTHWKSPETCSKDEGIHDMIYNREKLFLIIENHIKKNIRVELRSSVTLDRLWMLSLESANQQNVQIRCCLFHNQGWLLVHHDRNRLLHITKDGKLKTSCQYTPSPHFASTFGSNLLVIATSNSINLHRI